jgi:hypothetical protein
MQKSNNVLHQRRGTPLQESRSGSTWSWGPRLIDCKTTVRPDPLQPEWIYQLLGYALLDLIDAYHLCSVGIYLARQARLVTWPLAELLTTLTGGTDWSWPSYRTTSPPGCSRSSLTSIAGNSAGYSPTPARFDDVVTRT